MNFGNYRIRALKFYKALEIFCSVPVPQFCKTLCTSNSKNDTISENNGKRLLNTATKHLRQFHNNFSGVKLFI